MGQACARQLHRRTHTRAGGDGGGTRTQGNHGGTEVMQGGSQGFLLAYEAGSLLLHVRKMRFQLVDVFPHLPHHNPRSCFKDHRQA